MLKRGMVGAAMAAFLFVGAVGFGQEVKGKTVSLFNGKDLTGWKVLGCEAEVVDGAILIKAGNGLVQADGEFGDFSLDYEWKALKPDKWDSGVYFRYTEVPPGRPWPKEHQANLAKGMEGNVSSLPGASSKGLVKPGEWNRFVLTVAGTKASMEINGKPAWKTDGIKTPKGFLSLQAEVPNGGQFLFRNIKVTRPE